MRTVGSEDRVAGGMRFTLAFFGVFSIIARISVVGVAQLAERQVVALKVAGSNPVTHPII